MRTFLLALVAAAGCASSSPATRDPDAAKRGMEEAKKREPYLPMLSEKQAREAMPGFGGKHAPDLVKVAAHMPKTWAAEMAAWKALGEEGTIDRRLLSEVFYVVSSANDCFYCMGHMVMTFELQGVPEKDVLCIEETKDPKRRAIFAYARKASREPESITREDVQSLRPYLTDAQIVELDLAVCRFCTMNRLAHAFGVPLEKENVFAPPAKGKGKAAGTPGTDKEKAAMREVPGHAFSVVTAVKGNLVSVSAGSSARVQVGDSFNLSRGSLYVGRIRITAVDKNLSVGTFDTEHPGSQAPPQPGDFANPSSGD